MPYIKDSIRVGLDSDMFHSNIFHIESPGELNYTITKTILNYLNRHGKSYSTINDIVGALESAKLEFYRRVVVPYEDEKIQENGDVY